MGSLCCSGSAAAEADPPPIFPQPQVGSPIYEMPWPPRPRDLMVVMSSWYKTSGLNSHVEYQIKVCLRPNAGAPTNTSKLLQGEPPLVLWSVHRRYQEMYPVFRRLREIDKETIPEIPAGTVDRALRNRSEAGQSKEEERMIGFSRLFNAALSDIFLSGYPDLHKLLGAPAGFGSVALHERDFDKMVVFDPAFIGRIRDPSSEDYAVPPSPIQSPSSPMSEVKGSRRNSGSRGSQRQSSGGPTGSINALPDAVMLQNWRRVHRLGSGAVGTVWLGLLDDARQLAVKVVPWNSADVAAREPIQAEFALLCRLRHPNIVSVLGSHFVDGAAGSEFQIFLELVPGGSVAQLVRKVGRLPRKVVRVYTKQALEALAYLHGRGIVHRDVKGANLLLGVSGELKLADFGCSKCLGVAPDSVEPPGATTMAGTPFWMAPEVISPQKVGGAYGLKCDVWSLGCSVIEMLGVLPWNNLQGATAWETMYAIANAKTGPALPPDIDQRLQAFLGRCLTRDVSRRPSADALLLDDYFRHDS
eukprot:Hpha_TRINITY_DN5765_c0_g1::TRINITY_DN5765_c0_g1_i2::g.147570::m.147570